MTQPVGKISIDAKSISFRMKISTQRKEASVGIAEGPDKFSVIEQIKIISTAFVKHFYPKKIAS